MSTTTAVTEAPETGPFVCPPNHKHGRTVTCYKTHRCRCQKCRDRVAKVERERYQKKVKGTYQGMVPADASREHIKKLLAFGMTQRDILETAGMSDHTVKRILSHASPAVLPSTQRALLAVRPVQSSLSGGRVDSLGTRRRLQALHALGYTTVELSAMLGLARATASDAMRSRYVTKSTRDAVDSLYSRLSMTPAPESRASAIAHTHARKRGYVPPLAWDDIDDPNERPNVKGEERDDEAVDEVAVERALGHGRQKLTHAEKCVAVRRAHSWQWSDKRIADRLRITDRTVLRIREELALAAWPAEDQITVRNAA